MIDFAEQLPKAQSYYVQALNLKGEREERVIETTSRDLAIDRVRREGLFPYRVTLPSEGQAISREPVSNAALIAWFRSMKAVAGTGSLAEQLRSSSRRLPDKRLRRTIERMIRQNEETGAQLDELMLGSFRDFPAWIIGYMKIARESDKMHEAFSRLIKILVADERARRADSLVWLQPKILSVLFVALLWIVCVFLWPRVSDTASAHGVEIAPYIKWLFGSLQFMGSNPVGLMIVLVLYFGGRRIYKIWRRTEAGDRAMDRFKASLPGVGELLRLQSEARIARAIAFLMSVDAGRMRMMRELPATVSSYVYRDALATSARSYEISPGRLAPAFEESGQFTDMFLHQLAAAESAEPKDSAEIMEGCAVEFDEEVEFTRTTAREKLSVRMLYLFGAALVLVMIALLPVLFGTIRGLADQPAPLPSPTPAAVLAPGHQ